MTGSAIPERDWVVYRSGSRGHRVPVTNNWIAQMRADIRKDREKYTIIYDTRDCLMFRDVDFGDQIISYIRVKGEASA